MMDIYLDYNQIQLVVIGVFAFVGIFRGWLKELLTSFLLLLMALPLFYPSMADAIIEIANEIIRVMQRFLAVLAGGQMPEVAAFSLGSSGNAYMLFIGILAILVILSYMSDRIGIGQQGMTVFSALLGGLLGAFNGFMIITLCKSYVLGSFFDGTETQAQVAAATTVSEIAFTVENVPPPSFLANTGPILPVVIVGAVFLIVFTRLFNVRSPLSTK
jgi:hypothetical protein